ncbi:MAG: AAA family ATPase [Candidatus Lokiarchaeota archaeon]|nr:AAA family ATPase [Candidatus Lokiarchaeota archaeon]
MSSFDSKLYSYAVEEAKQAVILDRQGKYQQAINKYQRAAEILIQYMKYSKNEEMKKLCHKNSEDYINRAKILKSHVSGSQPRTVRSNSSPSSTAPKDDKVRSEGGELSQEEQEMVDMISGTIVTESPDIRWNDIAGLENCKQALREAIVLPMLKPELFTGKRKPWSGILLFGPPGCGKTLLAKAAATECKATFFSASSADLLSKWLGESEKLISILFKLARLRAPSLLFLDEIDSVATKRGSGSESSGERRVKTQLLSEIQGLKTSDKKRLLVLGATNRPWDIDDAMLSRFQKKVYVPLPDLAARSAIFMIETKGVEMDLDDDDFIELGVRSEGYSGRDISNACQEVIMMPVREMDMSGLFEDPNKEIKVRPINLNDFKKTLKKVKPMTSENSLQQYEEWAEEYGETT